MTVLGLAEFLLIRLAALLVLAGSAWAWGCCLLRLPAAHVAERIALRGAAGMLALSSGAFLLAACRTLTPAAAIGLLLVPWIAPRAWRETAALIGFVSRSRIAAALLALAATPCFLWAIYPPLGFDGTLYHLPMAQSLISDHRFLLLETLRFPAFPNFDELLFALLMPLAGDAGANLVLLVHLFLIVAALYAAGRRLPSPLTGWLAVALCLGSPLFIWETSAGMVDISLGTFGVCSLLAAERWRQGGGRAAAAWAGAFAGGAAAIKYTGLVVVVVVLASLVLSRAPVTGGRWRGFSWAVLATVLVAAPHYTRIALQTGNPIHPFFPAAGSDHRWQPRPRTLFSRERVIGGVRAFVAVQYEAVFARERWNREPPTSPAAALLLAASLGFLFRRGRERRWLAAALALLCLFLLQRQGVVHYLIPALAMACLPAARAGEILLRHRPVLARCAVFTIALVGPAYAAWRVATLGALPTTFAERDRFLAARVPGYEALAALNREHVGEYGVYGLHLEASRHFSAGRFVGDWMGPYSYRRFEEAAGSGAGLAGFLRDARVEFLLVAGRGEALLPRDPTFAASFEPLASYRDGTTLYRRRA